MINTGVKKRMRRTIYNIFLNKVCVRKKDKELPGQYKKGEKRRTRNNNINTKRLPNNGEDYKQNTHRKGSLEMRIYPYSQR